MINVTIKKSNVEGKKYAAIFINPKTGRKNTVNFGAQGYQDYTMLSSNDRKKRRNNYINRHAGAARENWDDITTPGFWSRWLLWNKKTLKSSAEDIERRFNVKIAFV